ncbi:MAG: type II toxin-antitoxin system HipA family toxin [Polyangiaceae bacterium]|nr:type II toxin-antitoxin system HipA family toxin [Polyangiaceae bacterium]
MAPSPGKVTLELRLGDAWVIAASVTIADCAGGITSASRVDYDFDYLALASAHLGERGIRALSCQMPLGYQSFDSNRWPPFLLDVMPSGAARRYWEARLGLPGTDGYGNDFALLVAGGGHAPGNVRVATAARATDAERHPGFPRIDVLDRAAAFIEYARASGAPVSGSSGAGGDAPKFLLREDERGSLHAEGVLSDERTRHAWLVKFPRTPDPRDKLVLQAEAAYHRVARRFGVRVHGELVWEQDSLFCPRFDRIVRRGKVEYLGMESLCSLAGVADFGVPIPKEDQARSLAACVTEPAAELRELLLRDVLDVALGNTDNHPRNTAVIKRPNGSIALSPLYDFAPMFLDPRGIARTCRWRDGAAFPHWAAVAEAVAPLGLPLSEARAWLRSLASRVRALPEVMREERVPTGIAALCEDGIARVAKDLEGVPA